MSTLRLPAERAAFHATARIGSGFHLSLVTNAPHAKACLNCGEPLAGKFCQECGQAAKTRRYTFAAFLHALPHEIFHLDHALPHTLKAILTKPGPTVRDYLAGKRAHVYSPIALLFMVGGLLAVLSVALHLTDVVVVGGNAEMGRFTQKVALLFAKYHAWVSMVALPLDALAPFLVLRRRTGLGYAEQMMAATMLAVGSAVIGLLFLPVLWLGHRFHHSNALTPLRDIAIMAYTVWAYAGLQNDGRAGDSGGKRLARSVAAGVGTYVVYFALMLVVCTGFLASFALTSYCLHRLHLPIARSLPF